MKFVFMALLKEVLAGYAAYYELSLGIECAACPAALLVPSRWLPQRLCELWKRKRLITCTVKSEECGICVGS